MSPSNGADGADDPGGGGGGGDGGEDEPLATDPITQQRNNTTMALPLSLSSSSNLSLSDEVIRIIFLLLGVGILIPWNAFVSAKPYFSARLCDDTIGQDVVNFEQYFGLVWNVSSVLSLGLVIVGQMFSDWWKKRKVGTDGGRINMDRSNSNNHINNDRMTTDTHFSNAAGSIVDTTTITTTTNSPAAFRAAAIRNVEQDGTVPDGDGTLNRSNPHAIAASSTDHSFYLVMGPLFLYLVVFSIQAGMVLIPHMDPHRFLIVTLVGLAVCGMCGAIATAGIVSTAGLFPSHIGINPFFSGQALGGVIVSVANFAAATLEDPHDYWHEHCDNLTDTTVAAATAAGMADASTTLARVEYVTADINDHQLIANMEGHISAEPPGCSLYHTLDWAVFSFFASGCIVLLLCLVGYQQIHKYRITQHRDDYVVVQDHPSDQDDTDLVVVRNNNDHVDVVRMDEEVSPTIGLELHNHIERRKQDDYYNNPTPTAAAAFDLDALSDRQYLVPESGSAIPTMPTKKSFPSSTSCPKPLVVCGCSNDNDHDEDNDENDTSTNYDNHRQAIAADDDYTDELDEGAVFSAIRGPVLCVFLVFTVTLCLFPSWVSELRSSHQCQSHFRLYNDLYVPWSFVLFNVGDLVGRLLSERVPVDQIRHLSKKLVVAAIGRAIYFPLFLMCLSTTTTASHGRTGDAFAATTTGEDSLLLTVPWWVIPSDVLSMTVQFTFAVTNGLLVSTAFMHSPHLVGPTTDLQERASEMMTFAVCFGLLSGSMLAFPYLEFATWVLK